MAQTFEGQVEITGAANRIQINLDATSGGLTQLFHPNGGNPHIELVANEIVPHNTGGGLINVTNGGGVTTIRLDGHAETIEAPIHQTTGGLAVLSGASGGLVQLLHPNGGNPHVELIANEVAPENTGGGLVNVANGGGDPTIRLIGQTGTVEAPIHQSPHGWAALSGANGGLLQLFHPNGGNPHVELIANETAPENNGGGIVNVRDGAGNTTIVLEGHRARIDVPGVQLGRDGLGGGIIVLTQANTNLTVHLGETDDRGGSIEVFNNRANLVFSATHNAASGGEISLFAANAPNTVGGHGTETVRLGQDPQSAGAISMFGPNGNTIVAISSAVDSPNNGFVGVTDSTGTHKAAMTFDLISGNSLVTADLKSFSMPHPTQPDTHIMYACIEGPEAAVFVRGTARLVNGEANVALPDHFVHVANLDTMTVQVTPLSADSTGLGVVGKGPAGFAVRELQRGRGNYDFDWDVKCVRKGHEDYRVTRPRNEMAALGSSVVLGPE